MIVNTINKLLELKCDIDKKFDLLIKGLEQPKELSEFKQEWYDCGDNFHSKSLTKAPQNLCYIEIEDSTHI